MTVYHIKSPMADCSKPLIYLGILSGPPPGWYFLTVGWEIKAGKPSIYHPTSGGRAILMANIHLPETP